jgi:hypothetical protein
MPQHPHPHPQLLDLIETSFCDENNGIEHDEVSVVSELTMEASAASGGGRSSSSSPSSLKLIINEVTSSMSIAQLKEQLHNLKFETNEKDIILKSKLDTLLDIKKKIDIDINAIKLKQNNLKPMKYIIKEVERKLINDIVLLEKEKQLELEKEEMKMNMNMNMNMTLTPQDGEVEI